MMIPVLFEPLSTCSITSYPLTDSSTSGLVSLTCFVCGVDASCLKASTPAPGNNDEVSMASPNFDSVVCDGYVLPSSIGLMDK
jgi:hypothetical protein